MTASALGAPNKRAEADAAMAAVDETVAATKQATLVESRVTWRPTAGRRLPTRLRSGTDRQRRRLEERWTLR